MRMPSVTKLGLAPIAILMSALAGACSGGPPKDGLMAPALLDFGYPSATQDGDVYARATIELDSAGEFGVDLAKKEGILAISLEVKKLNGNQFPAIILSDEVLDPRLYLADGTVLYSVPSDIVAKGLSRKSAKRVLEKAFRSDLLEVGQPIEGYLFFAIQPEDEIFLEGSEFSHLDGAVQRRMNAASSLMVFTISIDELPRSFFIGLRSQ